MEYRENEECRCAPCKQLLPAALAPIHRGPISTRRKQLGFSAQNDGHMVGALAVAAQLPALVEEPDLNMWQHLRAEMSHTRFQHPMKHCMEVPCLLMTRLVGYCC